MKLVKQTGRQEQEILVKYTGNTAVVNTDEVQMLLGRMDDTSYYLIMTAKEAWEHASFTLANAADAHLNPDHDFVYDYHPGSTELDTIFKSLIRWYKRFWPIGDKLREQAR